MVGHFLCCEVRASQHHLHGAVFAKGAGQSLRSACSRNDAQFDFRLSKLRIFRRHNHVTMHSQFAAAAKGIAANCRNQGLFDASNAAPVLKTAQQHIDRRFARHFFNIGTGCKRSLTSACEDDTAYLVVAIKLLQGSGKLAY